MSCGQQANSGTESIYLHVTTSTKDSPQNCFVCQKLVNTEASRTLCLLQHIVLSIALVDVFDAHRTQNRHSTLHREVNWYFGLTSDEHRCSISERAAGEDPELQTTPILNLRGD